MTLEEAAAAYPQAATLIMIHEENMPESTWDLARERGMSPHELQKHFLASARLAIQFIPNGPMTNCIHEFETADFTRYLRAKLGAL